MTIASRLTTPVLAPLLASRPATLAIAGAAAAQAALVTLGLPGWPCPILHGTGVPCPGCGLSRAIVALLSGEWAQALTLHAFAPLVLLALVLIAVAAALPARRRASFVRAVAYAERRTGLTGLALVGLLIYWAARLALLPAPLIELLRG